MTTLRHFILIGLCLFATGLARSARAGARAEIVLKIKKITAVSLKDALAAATDTDRRALARLLFFAKGNKTEELANEINGEIGQIEAQCRRESAVARRLAYASDCRESTNDLRKARDLLHGLGKDFDRLDSTKKVYYSFLVYSFAIRKSVLLEEANLWVKNCPDSDKSESNSCRERRERIAELTAITDSLVTLALARVQKTPAPPGFEQDLKRRIAAYERG